MIQRDYLLTQSAKPGIKNVSLALYRQFYEDVLMHRAFYYVLQDCTVLCVKFAPLSLYHLLGIQHIDRNINVNTFYSDIDNGLDFPVFRQNKRVKKRFIDMLDRLEMFSCTYHSMKFCRLFSVPSGLVNGTAQVNADYIIYSDIQGEGMSIGLRNTEDDELIPITILADRKTHPQKHIDPNHEKHISKLYIMERYRDRKLFLK